MHVSVLIVRSPNAGRGEDKFACVDSLVDRLFHYAGENFDVSCQPFHYSAWIFCHYFCNLKFFKSLKKLELHGSFLSCYQFLLSGKVGPVSIGSAY